MTAFRFHLIGAMQPIDLDVAVGTISELNNLASRQKFIEGLLIEPNDDGLLRNMLIATSRVQCVVEAG